MKRLLFLTAAGLTVVALAGAVGLPDLAGAQDASTTDSITVNGVGTVDAVPNEAKMSFGAETRRDTAQAAVAANADAMRKILNALRQAGGRELATQWVSVFPYTDEAGQVNGYVASNSVSAVSDVGDAPALIDAANGMKMNKPIHQLIGAIDQQLFNKEAANETAKRILARKTEFNLGPVVENRLNTMTGKNVAAAQLLVHVPVAALGRLPPPAACWAQFGGRNP